AGFGYNYATGSVRSKLELKSRTFLIADVVGEGSEHPEQSQGRWIAGVQYARPKWSAFFNAEIKALGRLQYRSWIAQIGVALPYEIGRGYKIIYKKRTPGVVDDAKRLNEPIIEKPSRKVAPEPKRRPLEPKKAEEAHPDMIFLQ
ncbi:MAG: hypothetical protein NDJ72_11750, partial [Elusimicrobia bacterium]|nr:hypothetical protein [Elusimicrobiota bacterium]